MIRKYCDLCVGEVPSNQPERLSVRTDRITLAVHVARDGTWNQGDVCHPCVRRLIANTPADPDA